jgi:hypothetical protein
LILRAEDLRLEPLERWSAEERDGVDDLALIVWEVLRATGEDHTELGKEWTELMGVITVEELRVMDFDLGARVTRLGASSDGGRQSVDGSEEVGGGIDGHRSRGILVGVEGVRVMELRIVVTIIGMFLNDLG